MTPRIVGIDLGTTNSELAVLRDDQIVVLPIHGNPIMPSCIGLDPQGALLVGQVARNQLAAAPERTLLSVKRRMGESVQLQLGDRSFAPEELSSFILRELKNQAEHQLGEPVRQAIITVPAFFDERQRKATQAAGELAGLDVLRLIHEPTAAALAYGAGSTEGETMLVYDLGGGTFDVSLVAVEQGVVEVKASHGDTHLGGDDFDQLLVDLAVTEFKRQHNVDLLARPGDLLRLRSVMERAKRTLSDEPFAQVREEYLDGQHHLEMELARDDYECLILPLLERTLACIHRALNDARLTPKDIHKVMLVGGATRTPLVHRLLQERLGLDPRHEINPDLIVAMGAAIQAGDLAGHKRHSVLVDITPHTYSTTAVSYSGGLEQLVAVPVIPRNTPLPASKSEVVYTMQDEQEATRVEAYQGEGHLPEQNSFIGEFLVEGLSPVPAGNPIVIHFDLDLNGILKVTATEKSTGLAKSVTLDTRGQSTLDLNEARSRIAALVGDGQPPAAAPDADSAALEPAVPDTATTHHELLTTAKDLRKRAEALLGRAISPEDAAEIRDLIHQSAEAIRNADWASLAQRNDTLSDLAFYLED